MNEARRKMAECPEHGLALEGTKTGYGLRLACPFDGCTVVLWDGSTSTPAEYETRQLRRRCHTLLDHKWNKERNNRNKRRLQIYGRLAKRMGVSRKKMHFGMLTKEQCMQAIGILETDELNS